MSNSKITPEEKLYAIHMIKTGKESTSHVAKRLSDALASVLQWITNYNSMGDSAFFSGNKHYSKKLKEQPVLEYLCGHGSQTGI